MSGRGSIIVNIMQFKFIISQFSFTCFPTHSTTNHRRSFDLFTRVDTFTYGTPGFLQVFTLHKFSLTHDSFIFIALFVLNFRLLPNRLNR